MKFYVGINFLWICYFLIGDKKLCVLFGILDKDWVLVIVLVI